MSPTLDEIKKIFEIDVKDNSTNDEDAVYDQIKTSTDRTFEEKSKEIKEILKDVKEDEVTVAVPVAVETKTEEPEIEVKKEEPKVVQEIVVEKKIDETVEIDFEKEMESHKEETEIVKNQEVSTTTKEELPAKEEVEETSSSPISSSIKLDDWNLQSPSPSFDRFYQEKKRTLDHLMRGDEKKPFGKYKKELKLSAVNTSIPTYDSAAVVARIREIQCWRDRVAQIQMDCRYIMWEMALDMLKGLLARVIYLKPAAKQPGINYEHLGDMEFYFAELKDTYTAAEIVYKNLSNAYETLSRQLPFIQPHPEKTVYEKKPFDLADTQVFVKPAEKIEKKEVPEQLKDFDELVDAKIEEVVKKDVNLEDAAHEVGWGDLF